jgi:hypothetical protein
MTPDETVRALFDRLHASDRSAMELFAPDAVRIAPDGRYDGRDAIAAFYEKRFQAGGLPNLPKVFFAHPPLVVALLSLTIDGRHVGMIDVFRVENGLITEIVVCPETGDA